MKDFYYILGTDTRCTPDEIDTAYRKLAQKLAPASGEQDHFLQSHLREISEAHEILSNPIKRRRYDDALKKNHKRELASFKAKNLSIATIGTLILFTALFGFYVVRALNNTGKPVQPVVVAETPVEASPVKVKHHKKKHHAKAIAANTTHTGMIKKDTIKHKQAAIIKSIAVARNTVIKPTDKQAKPIQIIKAVPVINLPATQAAKNQAAPVAKVAPVNPVPVIVSAPIVVKPDSSYATYIKPMAEQVFLHQQADYMSAVVSVLPNRSKIKVLAKGQTFYKVAYNEQVGYVPKWTIVKP